MTETLVQWFVTHLGGKAAKELIIFIISMIPILELREESLRQVRRF